jgi:hypothetical protein
MHHHLMQEEMLMARLTVTLDHGLEAGVETFKDSLKLSREAVQHTAEAGYLDADFSFLADLTRSLVELGDEPSHAALVREALEFYLGALGRVRTVSLLEDGYAEMAATESPKREKAIRFVTSRAAAAAANEP